MHLVFVADTARRSVRLLQDRQVLHVVDVEETSILGRPCALAAVFPASRGPGGCGALSRSCRQGTGHCLLRKEIELGGPLLHHVLRGNRGGRRLRRLQERIVDSRSFALRHYPCAPH